jgi:large subunit ribosomal protein L10
MAKTRQQKEEALVQIKEKLNNAKTVVFVDYAGLTVEQVTELRNLSRKGGSEYLVAKKTLLNRAANEQGIQGYDASQINGNLGILFGYEDEIAPAKIAKDFSKGKESFKILAGIMEGQFIAQDAVQQLASLPSKEELLAKLVGSLNAPLSGLVGVLNGVQRDFVRTLKAISEAK